MTKEEILQTFSDINYAYNNCSKYDTLKRMLDELTEPCEDTGSSENPNKCEDAISRQEVLDYIDKMPSELTSDGRRVIRRRTLEEYISDTLPSATPTQKMGRWIPVSERLPEEEGRYLTTIFNGIQYIMTCDYHPYSRCWFPDDECASDNVIAWMPLPEPYLLEKPTGSNSEEESEYTE